MIPRIYTKSFVLRFLGLFLACLKPVMAINPAISVSQYLRTSWIQQEGASLPAVQALAQTSDGYLWLGTANGLIRFDGMRFVRWEPRLGEKLPAPDILSLKASPQGGLWVSTRRGIVCLDHGHIVHFPAIDHWGALVDAGLFQDPAGDLWVAGGAVAGNAIAKLHPDGSFRIYGSADGLPSRRTLSLFEDSRRNLWLGTHDGLCRWSPGTPADCTVVSNLTVQFITAAGGAIVVADGGKRRIVRLARGEIQDPARQSW